jgi:hypothetical protein
MLFCFYLNPIILAAVEDADTAVIKPGINPDADAKVNIEPSMVLTTKLPTSPTYTPPYTTDAVKNAAAVVGIIALPPLNWPFSTYDAWLKILLIVFLFKLFNLP